MLTLYYLAFFEMLLVFLVALQRVKKTKSKIRVIIVLPRGHPIIKLTFVSIINRSLFK